MGITVEQFVAELGWDIDSTELEKFQGEVKDLGRDLVKLSKWIAAGTSAILGLATVTNEATARQYRLAQSVGASAETVEALAHSLGGLGFDSERVIDLVEEMSNKFGELKGLGEMSSATDALKILNLRFSELRDLAPEEQFIRIMDAAKGLADQQEAVSAVDMLMGGEANKVLGYLRTQEGTLGDMVRRYRDLAILTEEGRQGALKFSDQWRDLTLVGKSFVQQFSGQLGGVLAPMVDEVIRWAAANKDLIRSEIKQWAQSFGEFIRDIADAVRVLNSYIQEMGGYEVTLKRVGIAIAAWKIGGIIGSIADLSKGLDSIVGSKKGINGIGAALGGFSLPKALMYGGPLAIIGLAIEDIYTSITGGKGAFYEESLAIADYMSKVDTFAASLLGIPVDEFRASIVSIADGVIEAYHDVDQFLADLPGLIGSYLSLAHTSFINWTAGIDDTLNQWGNDVIAWVANLGTSIVKAVDGFLGTDIMGGIQTLMGGFDAAKKAAKGALGATGIGAVPRAVLPAPSGAVTNITNDNRSYSLASQASITQAGAGGGRELTRAVNRAMERQISDAARTLGGG